MSMYTRPSFKTSRVLAMNIRSIFFSLLCAVFTVITAQYSCKIEEIPTDIATLMIGRSWKPDCPVSLEDLRYLTMSYWGYDGQVHEGHMVVHAKIAQEVVEIFGELFAAGFPIERMELVDVYDADDNRSMEANNTSCFCFRPNFTNPSIVSNHGYGLAIDINPLVNPYVRGTVVAPETGRAFLDRTVSYKGMVTSAPDNVCFRVFTSRGYEWGGNWLDRQDYQHFAKNPTILVAPAT